MKSIAVLFEYPSLNGGENSLLAALEYLLGYADDIWFTALAPTEGALSARLDEFGVDRRPFSLFDGDGQRRDRQAVEQDIRSAVDDLGAALVHGNSLSMGRLLGRMAETLPVPSTAHLRDIIGLSGAAMRDLNRNARLIAVSEATRDFHVERGLVAARTVVVRNGIDADAFARSVAARREVREELGIPADAMVMLTAGQIGLRKGLDTLAAAAVELSRSVTGLHWLLAGERFSTKQESVEFEESVDHLFRAAEPHLTYHRLGWRSDMHRVMSAADVLVHAARQEPLGRVLLEAAAAGLAIVATDVGGTSEIVRHQESALLVPPDEPQQMADSVRSVVESLDLRTRLGRAARERVCADFGVAQCADALKTMWLDL